MKWLESPMNELIMHYEQPIILKIDKIINESDDTKTFIFNHELAYETGQFTMVWLPGVDESLLQYHTMAMVFLASRYLREVSLQNTCTA